MKKIIASIALLILASGYQKAQAQTSNDNKPKMGDSMIIEQNKQVVIRFNNEFFEKGNIEIAKELLTPTFVNHPAPPSPPTDASYMVKFVMGLHHGFSDISVHIDEIIADGDKVSLRKTITATHTGEFMGKQATGKKIVITVFDIDTLKDGKITDLWSSSNFLEVFKSL